MKVIIFGCGQLGAFLARFLAQGEFEVTVIDRNPRAFKLLGANFLGITIVGTGIDEDILKEAGIEKVDAFVAVTDGDKINIMSALIAKEMYGISKVIARVADPGIGAIYKELGLKIICPTTLGTETICEILQNQE
jgi:trk system potassium uptake protein